MDSERETHGKQEMILVGPMLPFRGGIAHYNSALFSAARASGLSRVAYSFSRQYPRWLYPGVSDVDPQYSAERDVEYRIDSLNPFTWWTVARQIASRAPALVAFHWWTIYWLPCFWIMIWILKRSGVRTALICHNVSDHDAGGLKSFLSRLLIGQADSYLVHSEEHARLLSGRFPGRGIVRHPIPPYEHYPIPTGLLDKRGRLELLFFGFIRPYKGLDVLLAALRELNDHDVYLTVVGEPWGDPDAIARAAEGVPNVELHLSYVDDQQAAEFFHRADFLVLPYRAATGSAAAALALHYDTPLLASKVGGIPDVVIDGLNGVLVPPSDTGALAAAIHRLDRSAAKILSEGVIEYKRTHNWTSLAHALATLASTRPNGTPPGAPNCD